MHFNLHGFQRRRRKYLCIPPFRRPPPFRQIYLHTLIWSEPTIVNAVRQTSATILSFGLECVLRKVRSKTRIGTTCGDILI